MTMARPARVLPSCSPYKPASGSTGGFSFGGASYISSYRLYDPSDYPYRQRASTTIHDYKANAAALAYEWSATTNAEASLQEARGAWQRLCLGYASLNGSPDPLWGTTSRGIC